MAALRDVYGVQHPVFLAPDQLAEVLQPRRSRSSRRARSSSWSDAPTSTCPGRDAASRRARGRGAHPACTAIRRSGTPRATWPSGSARRCSSCAPRHDGQEVTVFAAVVHDVEGRSRAAEVLNDLNVEARWVKFQLVRDRVFVDRLGAGQAVRPRAPASRRPDPVRRRRRHRRRAGRQAQRPDHLRRSRRPADHRSSCGCIGSCGDRSVAGRRSRSAAATLTGALGRRRHRPGPCQPRRPQDRRAYDRRSRLRPARRRPARRRRCPAQPSSQTAHPGGRHRGLGHGGIALRLPGVSGALRGGPGRARYGVPVRVRQRRSRAGTPASDRARRADDGPTQTAGRRARGQRRGDHDRGERLRGLRTTRSPPAAAAATTVSPAYARTLAV